MISNIYFFVLKEIVGAGGKTVWGEPAEIAKVLEGSAFDVVLDNNGKDLDAVKYGIASISVVFDMGCIC